MMQSYHIHRDKNIWIHFEPRFKDDAIPPHSRGPRPPDTFWTEVHGWCNPPLSRGPRPLDTFWTEVQGWCNPTTFIRTEISRYILNRGSGMMQSHHFHGGQDLWIHFEPRFRDDAIHHFHGGQYFWIHFEPRFRDDAITSGKLEISDQETTSFGHHSFFQGINDQNW